MKIENLDEILEKSFSLNDLARCFFNKSNYTNREKSKKILQENNINWQEWLNSKKREPNFCLFCGCEITGRDRYKKKFCNSSCSASYNNRIRKRKEVKYCSDRKEEKDHGADKGALLGYKIKDGDRVVIIEDVTTSGKSIEETYPKIKAQLFPEL